MLYELRNIIKIDRKKGIYGIVLAVLSFVVCAFFGEWIKGFLLALGFLAVGYLRIKTEKNHHAYFINFVWAFLTMATTCFSGFIIVAKISRSEITTGKGLLNILCIVIVAAIIFFITARFKLSVILTTFLFLTLSTVNGFIFHFRGKELGPLDFLSIKTAINVSSQYRLEIKPGMVLAWFLWLLFVFVFFSFEKPVISSKIRPRAVAGLTSIVSILMLQLCSANIPIKNWYEQGTLKNGYYLNFYLALRDSVVKKPENYTLKPIKDFLQDTIKANAEKSPESAPNIIAIMSESYSDFSVLGDNFNTNCEIAPFYNSLTEDTIKGYVLSSVFGANTANSEFEFLTGHSMAFLPENSVPYQQYINDSIYTMAWQMKDLGYESISTHPYWNNGWSRNKLYPLFGFSESTFFEHYPNEKVIRNYISDQEMFEFVVDKIKNKSDEKPLFLFGITMQNHGGYTYKEPDFENTVELSGYSQDYPKAEQYLSLVQESDKALQYLIEELKNHDEDTLVVFFGDHFPKVETEFYEEVHGGAYETLEEQLLQYKIPFMIWANYDIEEKTVPITSINFLSRYMIEAAGLELPPYHVFLKRLEEVIPAINAQAYYSKRKEAFIPLDKAQDEEAAWINQYEALQYNNLFDEENRDYDLFQKYINPPKTD